MCLLLVLALLAPPQTARLGALTEHVPCQSDPTQSYALFLPSSFSSECAHPVLLVFDPRGRAALAANLFREAAERHGWLIISSDNTRSDGPWEPNRRALAALLPELSRYPVDTRRIYAAGFSGGATVAWLLGTEPGLAGVVGVGGPMDPVILKAFDAAHFGVAGDADPNFLSMRQVDARLAKKGLPHRLEVFEGGHSWPSAELAGEAVDWLELVAMKQGRRARDAGLVEELFARDVSHAERLGRAGRTLAAFRRYQAIVDSFDGLRDVDPLRRRAAALKAEAASESRREDRALKWEEATRRNVVARGLARLRDQEQLVLPAAIAGDLQIEALKKRGREDSYDGLAARRVLTFLFVNTSFYLFRDLMADGEFARAAASAEIAARVRDDDARVRYNLACALARSGRKQDALRALQLAVRLGFGDRARIAADADLESLRGEPEFKRLVDSLPPP